MEKITCSNKTARLRLPDLESFGKIIRKYLKFLPFNYKRILLSGSIVSNEIVKARSNILSDIDVFVVTSIYDPIFEIFKKIFNEKMKGIMDAKMDINQIRESSLKAHKTPNIYCALRLNNLLKYSEKFPIPRWEGLKLLVNRGVELIKPVNLNKENRICTDNPLNITYSSMKAYFACMESLLIVSGKYAPTYYEKIQLLENIIGNYPSINDSFPEFLTYLKDYYSKRRNLEAHHKWMEEWLNSKDILVFFIDFILKHSFNYQKNSDNISPLIFQSFCPKQKKYKSLLYFKNLLLQEGIAPPLSVLNSSPRVIADIAVFNLLKSIGNNLTVNKHYLKKAYQFITQAYPLHPAKKVDLVWNAVKEAVVKCWELSPELS